jgi:hypothetical protein
MRMLRMMLLVLAFAAADLPVPAVPSALAATDQTDDDSGYHVSRRGASEPQMLRLPAPRTRDRVHVAPSPRGPRPMLPGRAAAHRSIRKVPPIASDPAPALEDQP